MSKAFFTISFYSDPATVPGGPTAVSLMNQDTSGNYTLFVNTYGMPDLLSTSSRILYMGMVETDGQFYNPDLSGQGAQPVRLTWSFTSDILGTGTHYLFTTTYIGTIVYASTMYGDQWQFQYDFSDGSVDPANPATVTTGPFPNP